MASTTATVTLAKINPTPASIAAGGDMHLFCTALNADKHNSDRVIYLTSSGYDRGESAGLGARQCAGPGERDRSRYRNHHRYGERRAERDSNFSGDGHMTLIDVVMCAECRSPIASCDTDERGQCQPCAALALEFEKLALARASRELAEERRSLRVDRSAAVRRAHAALEHELRPGEALSRWMR